MSIFDTCTDSCGWIAAVVAALAYGTYGVPIKETKKIPVNPLVFQSYKTITMFVSCWVVLLMGVEVSFTPWGLLSGLFWVLGGTGGIVAVRYAGMAIAVGTWASVMICVNFVFGILIFKEPVANFTGTAGAFVLLALGLIGMSKYSAPTPPKQQEEEQQKIALEKVEHSFPGSAVVSHVTRLVVTAMPFGHSHDENGFLKVATDDESAESASSVEDGVGAVGRRTLVRYDSITETDDGGETELMDMHNESEQGSAQKVASGNDFSDTALVTVGGLVMRKRTAGILGAVFNGLMTGSSFIPVHYAKTNGFGGAHYFISYSVGALIANIVLWIGFFAFNFYHYSSFGSKIHQFHDDITVIGYSPSFKTRLMNTYESLPELYFRQLWLPGVLAGKCIRHFLSMITRHSFSNF
jgi:hypothetical protein